jgi:hypothetical protein
MKFVAWLAGGSILAAIVFSAVSGMTGLGASGEIWFGMLGPTLASIITWMAIERQRRLDPQKMLKCLIQSFVIKFVFFGAYIAVVVKTNQVRPGLFVGCFAFFYLALHMAEALELRKTQAGPAANDINRQ